MRGWNLRLTTFRVSPAVVGAKNRLNLAMPRRPRRRWRTLRALESCLPWRCRTQTWALGRTPLRRASQCCNGCSTPLILQRTSTSACLRQCVLQVPFNRFYRLYSRVVHVVLDPTEKQSIMALNQFQWSVTICTSSFVEVFSESG